MHLISLTIPFYSHLKSQKSLLESFLDAGHQVTIMTHSRLGPLVEQIGAELHAVDRMDSFLDNPAIQQANGMAYTGAMMRETANKIDEMTAEVASLDPDGIIFDSATRRGKIIGLRLGVPMVARSAMYPPLYQYNRTKQIKKQLLRDAMRSPISFVHIGQAITKLIFEQKPKDYEELYSRLYNDNDIRTCTAIPHCLFESNEMQNLHTYQHHGIALDEHTEDDSDWTWLQQEERLIVYVSLGTLISIDQEILDTLEAVSKDRILFVVSTGPHGSDGRSKNVVWKSFLPQKQILDISMFCITHAGANTVIECMARKLPMVCIPYLIDQYLYSYRIQQLGIGVFRKKIILRNAKQLEQCLGEMMVRRDYLESAYDTLDLQKNTESYASLIARFEEYDGTIL